VYISNIKERGNIMTVNSKWIEMSYNKYTYLNSCKRLFYELDYDKEFEDIYKQDDDEEEIIYEED